VSEPTRVQLGWDAPVSKLERFEAAVESEWGGTSPYVGIQIEQSWREYRRSDEQHRLEAIADDIVEATGRSSARSEKKNLPRTGSTETDKVWNRVHEDVKEEMSAYATECNVPNHVVLEGVIDWYLDGGREQSVIDKLDGVVEDIQDTFATVNGDATEMTKAERTTIAIANRLNDQFTADELGDAIDAETSGSDYYHDQYTERVIDYKEVKRLEITEGPDIFVNESVWKARLTGEIIDNLGGNRETNTAPDFSKHDLADAIGHAGIEVSQENSDTVNEFRERVLDRLDFVWVEDAQRFTSEPSGGFDTELSSYSASSITAGQSWDDVGIGTSQEAGADD